MSRSIDNVPSWVRFAVGVLALMNIAYGVLGYFDMHVLFPSGFGFEMSNQIIRNACYEFSARNLAIGLGLGFVTLIKGAPEALVILTIVRALIELQTIIFSGGVFTPQLFIAIVFITLEIFIIRTLIKVIRLEEDSK